MSIDTLGIRELHIAIPGSPLHDVIRLGDDFVLKRVTDRNAIPITKLVLKAIINSDVGAFRYSLGHDLIVLEFSKVLWKSKQGLKEIEVV